MPDEPDRRTAELEAALDAALEAAPAGPPSAARALRVELAGHRGGRYVTGRGTDDDRRRAEVLADAVLADPDATLDERQRMAVLSAMLTMVSRTAASALRGHPTLDAEALCRTDQWTAQTDPADRRSGVATLREQLDAIPDIASLPPELQPMLAMLRVIAPLLDPDSASPADLAQVADLAATAPQVPGAELFKLVALLLDTGTGAPRIAELEAALAGLTGDHLVAPVLRHDLARELIANTGETGLAGLRRATELLEQAANGVAPDHPLHDETRRMLAGALVSVAGTDATAESRARAEQVAAEVLARPGADDPDRRGPDLFLRSLVGLLRGVGGSEQDGRAAVGDLVAAIDALPPGHALRPVAVGQLGAVLADRHLTRGMLDNREAARHLVDEARAAAHDAELQAFLTTVAAVGRVHEVVGSGDGAAVTAAADGLRAALAGLPPGHPLRANFALVLAVTDLKAAVHGAGDVHAALTALRQVTADGVFPGLPAAVVGSISGSVDVLHALLHADGDAVAAAIDDLEAQVARPVAGPVHRAAQHALLGKAYLAAHDRRVRAEAAADRAVDHLQRARRLLEEHHADVPLADVLRDLATAHRVRGEHEPARATAFAALATHAGTVLLQTGVAHAVVTARGAVADATALARWCVADGDLADAVRAVELGRGLALHAATSALRVPRVLDAAGRPELATAWRDDVVARSADPAPWSSTALAAVAAGGPVTDYARASADVRHRVLDVLRGTPEGRRLFTAPSTAAVGDALRTVGADVFVYLLPGNADAEGKLLLVDRNGTPSAARAPLLRVDPDGPVARWQATSQADTAGWRAALDAVCDWAGPAVLEPLRAALPASRDPRRVVLAPPGALGAVPWAAGRLADGRYACAELVLSTAASARQLLDVAGRAPLPGALDPVLLADPRGDLLFARDEVLALQDAFYPHALVLGDFHGVEPADGAPIARGAGTLAEVLAQLPGARTLGASLLHLACHAWTAATAEASYLELTARLTIREVVEHAAGRASGAPGPVVVLSACRTDVARHDADEALTLATSVLVAGAVAVVASRWAVDDRRTPILMFAFHHFLAATGQAPTDALRSAQLWMLDPHRPDLPGMPEAMHGDVECADLTDVAVWAAFAHHGR